MSEFYNMVDLFPMAVTLAFMFKDIYYIEIKCTVTPSAVVPVGNREKDGPTGERLWVKFNTCGNAR